MTDAVIRAPPPLPWSLATHKFFPEAFRSQVKVGVSLLPPQMIDYSLGYRFTLSSQGHISLRRNTPQNPDKGNIEHLTGKGGLSAQAQTRLSCCSMHLRANASKQVCTTPHPYPRPHTLLPSTGAAAGPQPCATQRQPLGAPGGAQHGHAQLRACEHTGAAQRSSPT